MVAYSHRPLNEGHIRIMTVLPGHDNEKVRCRTTERSGEKYEALSLCWGNLDETTDIDVYTDNDQCPPPTLRIKPNLEVAIKRLRYKNQDRCLWIDAICINQADKHERNL